MRGLPGERGLARVVGLGGGNRTVSRTRGTAEAAAKLVEISKGKVAAFVFVINLFDLGGSDNLIKNNYKVENLMEFPGH